MFTVSHMIPIKEIDAGLTRSQIWQGLVLKAENPVPFLEAMTACSIVERGHNWLLRDFTLRGEEMQEQVEFEPEKRVVFTRTKSTAMGTILNEIVDLDEGLLGLQFAFNLDVEGLTPGTQEEADYADHMSKSYF
ncbi:MAG: AtaL-like protein [Pseudomonadota bacterium]|nr:AtaL-like protein [Pseudomonadota bacterium]